MGSKVEYYFLSSLIVVSSIWLCECLTESCSFVQPNRKHVNTNMKGHVFEAKILKTFSGCLYECMVTTDCLSLNYNFDSQLCELNAANSTTAPLNLVAATGKVRYTDIDLWPKSIAKECEGVDCAVGHRCVPTKPKPMCLRAVVDCGTPTTVPHTETSPGTSTLGSVREYQCLNGYHSNSGCDTSKMITTCQPTSQWSPTDFKCWSQDTLDACSSSFLSGVPDSALSASSFWADPVSHGPERSRLNTVEGTHMGAWSAGTNDINQWLQVDLQDLYFLRGIITQGRHGVRYLQWVTAFKALYSTDCKTWTHVGENNQTETVMMESIET